MSQLRILLYSNYRVPEDLVRVKILLDEDKSFLIGVSVKGEEMVEMLLFLVQNVYVFA